MLLRDVGWFTEMKFVLILVLLLLLLGGGGAGGYFFYWLPKQEAEHAAPKEEPPPPPMATHPLGSVKVPVIQNGAVVRYLQLELRVEFKVPNAEASPMRDEVERYKPRLMDALLRDLIAFFEYQPRTGPVPLTALEERMTALVDRQLPGSIVGRVIIENASEAKH